MKNKQEIMQDLENKVMEFYDDLKPFILRNIESLSSQGCSILEDHATNGKNYITPRLLASALFREFAHQAQFKHDKKSKDVVKHYQLWIL